MKRESFHLHCPELAEEKIAFVWALLVDYEVLLLDEPFNGLDPDRRRSIAELILHETE